MDEPARRDSGPGPSKKQEKQHRVSKACEWCRRKKDRCDGQKPACGPCVAANRLCSYDPTTKKRGLPEGYVRGIEKTWALAIRSDPAIEEKVVAALEEAIAGGLSQSVILQAWHDEGPNGLVTTWKESRILRELERFLHSLEGSQAKRLRQEELVQVQAPPDQTAAHGNGFRLPPRPAGQDCEEEKYRPSTVEDGDSRFPVTGIDSAKSAVDSGTGTNEGDQESSQSARLPDNAWALIETYFAYTQNWFPILSRPDILRIYYQCSNPKAGPNNLTTDGERAVLWAVLSQGCFQISATDSVIDGSNNAGKKILLDANYLQLQARKFIPHEGEYFQIEHVQALLILSLSSVGHGKWNEAWLSTGMAVRMAIILGLGDLCGASTNKLEKDFNQGKSVLVGCFILDTLVSSRLGLLPHLRKADFADLTPLNENVLEEWDPWKDSLGVLARPSIDVLGPSSALSTFNRLAEVTKAMNELICARLRDEEKLRLRLKIRNDLQQWNSGLLSMVRIQGDRSHAGPQDVSTLPHHVYLHAVHLGALVATELYCADEQGQLNEVSISVLAQIVRQMDSVSTQYMESFRFHVMPPTYEHILRLNFYALEAMYKYGAWDARHTVYLKRLRDCSAALASHIPVFVLLTSQIEASDIYNAPAMSPVDSRVLPTSPLDRARKQSLIQAHVANSNTGTPPLNNHNHNHSNNHSNDTMDDDDTALRQFFNAPTPSSLRTVPTPATFPHSHSHPIQHSPITSHPGPVLSQQQFTQHSPPMLSQPSFGQTPPVAAPTTVFSPTRRRFSHHVHTNSQTSALTPENNNMDPFGSESDGDSIFHGFAPIDVTEWATNWDQGLANLGFTDTGNGIGMDQAFNKFWQDMDSSAASASASGAGPGGAGGAGGGGSGSGVGPGGSGNGASLPHS